MSVLRNISSGLRSLFRKEQVSQELDDELNGFLEMAAEEKMKQGMSRKDALRAVRLERGNLEVTKEAVRAAGWESFVETLWRDLRFAARVLRKSPGFTAASVLTLALGVIAETGYNTVLAQLPDAGEKILVEPRQVIIKLVSENYFSVLGVNAIAGRMFTEQEHGGAEPVAVLSYSSWQRRFHGDPAVVGQSVLLYRTPITIIGIAPVDFIGTGLPPVPPDLWIPLPMQTRLEPGRDSAKDADESRLRVVGRLRPDVTARQARAELTAIAQLSETNRG